MARKLALIIGNSQYEDTKLARLVTPDIDVSALASVLQAPEVGGFDQVTLLVNELESAVRRAIVRFFVQKRRDDLLLLYFSGHGILDDHGHLYLAVKDTEHNLLSATGIPAALITHEMDRSLSRRQVLILDCCHSGAFARGTKGAVGASVHTAAAFEGNGYGRVVLTATDGTQYAWEGDAIIGQPENSVFTHYLVQGLRTGEADADADGQITLDEIYNYVYERMANATSKQTPGKWSYKQQGEIILAKNPRPVLQSAPLPAELQQAIESPFAAVREGAVRELGHLLQGRDPSLARAARKALEDLKNDDSRLVSTRAKEVLGVETEFEDPMMGQVDAVEKTGVWTSPTRPHRLADPADTKRPETHVAQPVTLGNRAALVVRQITKGILLLHLALLGWGVGGVMAAGIGTLIADEIGPSSYRYSRYSGDWSSAWGVGAAIGGIIVGCIGGFTTGLALRQTKRSMRWKRIVIATIYGTIALSMSGGIGSAIGGAIDGWDGGAIGWVIGGVIGSSVMMRCFRKARRQD